MVAMPLGVAAGIMTVLLKLHVEELFISEIIDLSNWKLVLIAYACIALATIYVLRRIFNKSDKKEDINYY